MSEENRMNARAEEFEAALKLLAPRTARVDPVAAAFAAGNAMGRRQLRIWQSAAAVLLIAASAAWLVPDANRGVVRSPHGESSTLAVDRFIREQPPAEQSVLMLRRSIEEKGVDGLPAENVPAIRVVRASDLF